MLVYKNSNNEIISPNQPFTTPEGNKYPANWLRFANATDLASANIFVTIADDPLPAPPSPQQIIASKIANGIAITSTSSPSLNATYAIDPMSQAQIEGVSEYIGVNQRFPAGLTALPWPDISGSPHLFNMPQFLAFGTAVADVVTAISLGQSPPQTATIP